MSFLVIGGAAVAHHGFVRATKDLDIIPSPTTDNLGRLYERLDGSAEEARYDSGTVRFVGYADLLDFKNIAGRDQDLIDIRALREARDDMGPGGAR